MDASTRIEELEREIARLNESERRYRLLFEAMDEGYALCELVRDAHGRPIDYRTLEVNPAYERHTGTSGAEVVGRLRSEHEPGSGDRRLDLIAEVVETGVSRRIEYLHPSRQRWISAGVFAVGGDRFGSVFRDVTEQMLAEAALREREQQLARAFEAVPVGIAVIDREGVMVRANAEMRRFLPEQRVPSSHPEGLARWSAWTRTCEPVEPNDFPTARALRGEKVVPGLDMLYRSDDGQELWTTVSAVPLVNDHGDVTGTVSVVANIDALKRSEEALRASRERQAFLLQLTDTLRPRLDPDEIAGAAMKLLGERLGAQRACYLQWPVGEGYVDIRQDYRTEGLPSVAGRYPTERFASAYSRISGGQTWAVADAAAQPGLEPSERDYDAGFGLRSWVNAPLVKGGRVVASLCVVQDSPRHWTADEVTLVEETAERCWAAIEWARADTVVRASEQRLKLSVEVAGLGLWDWNIATGEVTWSAEHYEMQGYLIGEVAPSYEAWLARVHPDDRRETEAVLEAAMHQHGDYVHEFRTLWPSGEVRWVSARGRFFYDADGRPVRMIGAMVDTTVRRSAEERQAILMAELQHRVRNILATVRSVVNRTGNGEEAVQDYKAHLVGRLDALARTQSVLTRSAGRGVDLEDLIREELLSQSADDDRVALDGPAIVLAPKAAEVLTLAIHELATNATKYGAFSRDRGRVEVSWREAPRDGERWLELEWRETGVSIVTLSPRREGFGTELITRRVPYELKGEGALSLRSGGAICRIGFPLRPGESVLQVGFGGEGADDHAGA